MCSQDLNLAGANRGGYQPRPLLACHRPDGVLGLSRSIWIEADGTVVGQFDLGPCQAAQTAASSPPTGAARVQHRHHPRRQPLAHRDRTRRVGSPSRRPRASSAAAACSKRCPLTPSPLLSRAPPSPASDRRHPAGAGAARRPWRIVAGHRPFFATRLPADPVRHLFARSRNLRRKRRE